MPVHTSPIRCGIIGTGAIAHAHAHALTGLHGRAELAAVAEIDPDRAAAFTGRFPVPAVYGDAAAMLEKERLDLVHVCTPPQTHVPLAIAAMRAGVPVLVEKPTALSLAEMDELADVQAATGTPVLTVFQHRYGPAAVRLRRLAAAGALGRPLVATCETLWYRDDAYFDVPWRGRWEVEGGGPTMGHGIHQFDLLLSILGPWAEITALAGRLSRPTNTEDVSMALDRFKNGAMATVVNSVVSPREASRLRFDFEHATVELEHLYGYRDADWRFTPAPGHEDLADRWNAADQTDEESGHRLQIAAVVDALAAGTEPGVTLAEARRTMEFAAATYAAAFQGRPVAAGEITGSHPFARSMDGGAAPWAPIKGKTTA
ncbi:Gfo/Idh/MocA family oxidoreductase [Glycomyces sp. TRM65418]|uniref:Gfo/Idh/MocA family protein n=1 Tax=Glycomyces sp. TRM65418 TaxID=2867006 RepID=UPI001CE4E915|nr:Gfo/Idh/MocA family oxidoreductase [Glycomyces sp. TRM65418]MCC3761505.1 Gfo/Idh/MocA family oxidoreductase [Glycomyces sp. TRM65418]QZD55603.1 Gfo/Idh/MocA family oxidoreductase [Glycomyces sp. TRM65418]